MHFRRVCQTRWQRVTTLLESMAVIFSSACSHPGLVWPLPPLSLFPEGCENSREKRFPGVIRYAELGGTQKDPQIPACGPAQDTLGITPCAWQHWSNTAWTLTVLVLWPLSWGTCSVPEDEELRPDVFIPTRQEPKRWKKTKAQHAVSVMLVHTTLQHKGRVNLMSSHLGENGNCTDPSYFLY